MKRSFKVLTIMVVLIISMLALSACASSQKDSGKDQVSTVSKDSGEINLYTDRHYDTDE